VDDALVRAALALLVLATAYGLYRLWRLPPRPLRRLRRLDLEALGLEGPAIVQFSTPTCAPCRAAAPRLEATAREAELRYAQVNVAHRPDVARRYGIRTVPTIAVVGRGGAVVDVWTSLPHNGELLEAALRARARSGDGPSA
jgi:thiol-disulfide isomerase/thioredoxin